MVTHRINRVEFELEVSAVELGRRLSDRVSVLHGSRIPNLLDRVCTEFDDADAIDRIDMLELDLGVVSLANFDDDLCAKLEAALRQALRGRPGRGVEAPTQVRAEFDGEASEVADAAKLRGRAGDARELLDIYAWTGNLPWWADARAPEVVALHVRNLLVHAPASWVELLREHADDPAGLARLARVCGDELFELFELIIERAGAVEALPDLRVLDQLLAVAGVRGEHWRASLLGALGRHGRLETQEVLPAVLRDLDADVIAGVRAQLDREAELGTTSLRAAIAQAASLAARRRSTAQADRARERDETHEAAGVEIELAAAPTEPIHPTPTLASTLEPAPDASAIATITDDATSLPRPEHLARPEPASSPTATRPSTPSPARTDEPRLQFARRRALGRLEELYIEDAGLVILWPFLERLFTRIELLDKRRFRDEAAQTQAIALLAYLGLEDPEPPEHRLAFAKLLCGRPPEHPCEFEGPLAPELREECDTLLAAVIDHAPVLDAMPIPQFRASFLQRAGALTVRTGSWLLCVERQPWDLVLDRFSWSWAWIKLPWMSEPVTVEW